ncbi:MULTISPECIES: SGNH/GDSL hydrolase family protein [unclassified Erwinia]|uniref:SGNH/GDSL hydrolase family protein n=1 Tax=unclassified Erwinia TaxID=2622719 RepID=UPI0006F5E66E|nr:MULTISPECIES: SGNH/GDSL hydrolase family protein [unclassified Erwinia]KQN60272.1 hypothetical protein ASF13_22290 [Erwinia sp. Leaf53]PLV60585.1 hypothetical protein NV64_12600 [Erwinia sp. B116]
MKKNILFSISLVLLGGALSSVALASEDDEKSVFPVVELDNYLGETPLIKTDFDNNDRPSQRVFLGQKSTYTYMRCITRLDNNQAHPGSTWYWAKNESGSGYYKLNGHWWSNFIMQWKNMFYTDTPYKKLEEICRKTLASEGVNVRQLEIYAADNSQSFDHTIWSMNYDAKGLRKNGAFERIITFGDSLTDNSNVFNASMWKAPNSKTWYRGHFSNGYVWHEYLAGNLGIHSYNWAVGGAETKDTSVLGLIKIPGIDKQIDSFVSYMNEDKNYNAGKSLFSIMAGGNDLMNGDIEPEEMISNIDKGISRLTSLGAKSIIVMTAPDVSLVPGMQDKSDSERLRLKDYVRVLNNGIKESVKRHEYRNRGNVDIYLIDVEKIFNDLVKNPGEHGIDDVKHACLDINNILPLPDYIFNFKPSPSCRHDKVHLFWDNVHPTTYVHELISTKIMAAIIQHYNLTIEE